MKRLFIIRHAKSDHGPQYQSDFERPLNQRGRNNARRMAMELKKVIPDLDLLLISSATRTKQTAAYFIEEMNLASAETRYSRALYLPQEDDIWNEVRDSAHGNHDSIVVFSHNPAVEDLLHRFHPGVALPTCSIIELHFDGADWKDIGPETARFVSHKYPKMYE